MSSIHDQKTWKQESFVVYGKTDIECLGGVNQLDELHFDWNFTRKPIHHIRFHNERNSVENTTKLQIEIHWFITVDKQIDFVDEIIDQTHKHTNATMYLHFAGVAFFCLALFLRVLRLCRPQWSIQSQNGFLARWKKKPGKGYAQQECLSAAVSLSLKR